MKFALLAAACHPHVLWQLICSHVFVGTKIGTQYVHSPQLFVKTSFQFLFTCLCGPNMPNTKFYHPQLVLKTGFGTTNLGRKNGSTQNYRQADPCNFTILNEFPSLYCIASWGLNNQHQCGSKIGLQNKLWVIKLCVWHILATQTCEQKLEASLHKKTVGYGHIVGQFWCPQKHANKKTTSFGPVDQ